MHGVTKSYKSNTYSFSVTVILCVKNKRNNFGTKITPLNYFFIEVYIVH